jgi:hypothetical protein
MMLVLNGNLTISTPDNFDTIAVSVLGNFDEQLTSADKRISPVSIPGSTVESWKKTAANGDHTTFEIVNFPAISLSYLQFATIYHDLASPGSNYSHQFITLALGKTWTPSYDMPTTGSATYNGMSYGIANNTPPGIEYRTTSAFQMSADFTAGTVSGNLSNFNFFAFDTGAPAPTPSAATGLTLSFSTAINGSTFSDQLKSSGNNVGGVEGQFAGPTAQEVGGAYHAITPDLSISGAFAGKR